MSQSGDCAEVELGSRLGALLEASEATGDGWKVSTRVEARGDTHEVVLSIEDPSGGTSTRTLSSPSCEVALDAAAFVVASAIDPTLEAPEAAPEPEPEPEPEPDTVPEPDLEPEPEPEPEPAQEPEPLEAPPPPPTPSRRPDFWIGLGPGMMAGAVPGLVGRLVMQATVEGKAWRVRLDVAGTTRADARSTQVPAVGADIGLWAFGGRGCGVLRVRRAGFSGCLGAEVGQVYASGFGFPAATSTLVPWGAAIAALGVDFQFRPRWRVWAEAEGGLSLNRASIVVDNLEALHQVGAGFGRSTLGLAVRI